MRSANQVQIVLVEKLRDDFSPEREAHSAIVLSPAHRLLVRIRPEQIAQQTLIRYVCRSHDATNLLHRLQIGRQSTVAAEDLLVDDSSDREAVETIGEGFPEFDVVSSFTCASIVVIITDRDRVQIYRYDSVARRLCNYL